MYRSSNRRLPTQSRLAKALPYLAVVIAVSVLMVLLLLAAVLYAVLNLNPCQGEMRIGCVTTSPPTFSGLG